MFVYSSKFTLNVANTHDYTHVYTNAHILVCTHACTDVSTYVYSSKSIPRQTTS